MITKMIQDKYNGTSKIMIPPTDYNYIDLFQLNQQNI